MNRFLLIVITCLMLCSCGNRSAKKAEQEAQKAQTEYQQTVINGLKTRMQTYDSLLVIFNSIETHGLAAPAVADIESIEMLSYFSDDPATFNKRSTEIRQDLDNAIEFLHYATAGQK